MLNRVRLVGATPRLVSLDVDGGEWRLDLDGLREAVTERTRVVFSQPVERLSALGERVGAALLTPAPGPRGRLLLMLAIRAREPAALH